MSKGPMGGGLWGQHVWSGSALGQALAQKTHIKLLSAEDLLDSRMHKLTKLPLGLGVLHLYVSNMHNNPDCVQQKDNTKSFPHNTSFTT